MTPGDFRRIALGEAMILAWQGTGKAPKTRARTKKGRR
jgi:hypothetical protein